MATQKPATPAPKAPPKRSRKSVAVAVILQSIPLLGAGGCTAMAVSDQQAEGLALILWFSVLFWGLGYAYAGLRKWFVPVLLLGPLFALVSCTASVMGASFDYEHMRGDVPNANRASLQEALIIAASVVLLAVHVWRAVEVRNAEVDLEGPASPQPAPESPPTGEKEPDAGKTGSYRLKPRKRPDR